MKLFLFLFMFYEQYTLKQCLLIDSFTAMATSVNWDFRNMRELRSEALLGKAQNRGLAFLCF